MMAHFGVMGLKDVVLSDNFDMVISSRKVEKKPVEGAKSGDGTTPVEVVESSKGSTVEVIPDPVKLEKNDRARNMIILNIGDQVLRTIKHCENAASMCATLDRLYVSKSLSNRIFVQSQFYTFKCEVSKNVCENVEFLRIVAYMSTMNVNVLIKFRLLFS